MGIRVVQFCETMKSVSAISGNGVHIRAARLRFSAGTASINNRLLNVDGIDDKAEHLASARSHCLIRAHSVEVDSTVVASATMDRDAAVRSGLVSAHIISAGDGRRRTENKRRELRHVALA